MQAAADLSFAPSVATDLRRMAPAQIAHYNEDGYVAPFGVFDASEIAEVRAYVDRLMAAKGDAGAYGINCYQARLAGLWDIATNDLILDHVQDIIGPDVVCWASAILSKRPRDPREVPWHQDAGFWKLSPARTVTVWLAIDDADETNAAMRFVPGTHSQGAFPEVPMGEGSVFHKGISITGDMAAPVTNALRAGQSRFTPIC